MKSRQAAVIFIFITVVLDMLAIGLIAPVLPKLVLSFLNNDMRRAANWNGIFLTVFAAMQFFFSPVIGVLSDRIGRARSSSSRALDSVSITSMALRHALPGFFSAASFPESPLRVFPPPWPTSPM